MADVRTAPVIVLTGGTGAVGGAAAVALARGGATLVLPARDQGRALEARATIAQQVPSARIEIVPCDLASLRSVHSAAVSIRTNHPQISGLIHCAGVLTRTRRTSADGFELMFATNHLAAFLLTEDLLPALEAGAPSRVITVSAPSTSVVNFEDIQSAQKFNAYSVFGASKMANLLFAFELSRRLSGTGVTSNVFFPGLVKSGLLKEASPVVRFLAGLGATRREEVGAALARLALDPSLATVTGRFYRLTSPRNTTEYAHAPKIQQRLREISEQLVASAIN